MADLDPYAPKIRIADLKEALYSLDPHLIIPNRLRLAELQDLVADIQRSRSRSRSRTASRSSTSPRRTLRSALKPPIASSNTHKNPLPSSVKLKQSPPSPKSRPPPSPKSRLPPSPKSRPTPPPSPKAKSSSKPPSKSKAEDKPMPLPKRKVGIPLSSTSEDRLPAPRSVKFALDPPRNRCPSRAWKGVSDSTVSATSSDHLTPGYSQEGSFDEEDSPPPSKKNRTPNNETQHARASRRISSTSQSSPRAPVCATDYRATPSISPSRRRSCLKRPVKEPSPSPTSSDDSSLRYSKESYFDNGDSPPTSKRMKSPASAYKSASNSHQPIFLSDSSSNEHESDPRLRRVSPANKAHVGTRMPSPSTGISRSNIDPDLLLMDDFDFTSSSTPIFPQPVSRSSPSMNRSPVPPLVNNTTRPINIAAPSNKSPEILAFASTPATAGCIDSVPGHPNGTFNFCSVVPSRLPEPIISDSHSSPIDHFPNVAAATFQSQHQTSLTPHLNSSLAFLPVESKGIALAAHWNNPPAPLFPGTSNMSFHQPKPIVSGSCRSTDPAPSVPANWTVKSNDSKVILPSTTKVAQATSHDPTLGYRNPTINFSAISQVSHQTVMSESTGSQGLASVPHSDQTVASLPSTDKLAATKDFLNSLLTGPWSDPEGNMTLNELRRKYDLENNARHDHLFDSCVFRAKETLEHLKQNPQYQPASKNIVGNLFNQHPFTFNSSILQPASKSTPFCNANQEQFKSPNQFLYIDPSLLDTRSVPSASVAVSTAPAIMTSAPAPIATAPATFPAAPATNFTAPAPVRSLSPPHTNVSPRHMPNKTVPLERSPAVPFGSRIKQAFTFGSSAGTASAAFPTLAPSAIPPAPVTATTASATIQTAASTAVLTAPAAVPPAPASFPTTSAAVPFPPAVIPTAPPPPPVPAVIPAPPAASGPTLPAAAAN